VVVAKDLDDLHGNPNINYETGLTAFIGHHDREGLRDDNGYFYCFAAN
jgi:hypothetical protein